MAKREGDWWRIPAALFLALAAIPVWWLAAVEKHLLNYRKKIGGQE